MPSSLSHWPNFGSPRAARSSRYHALWAGLVTHAARGRRLPFMRLWPEGEPFWKPLMQYVGKKLLSHTAEPWLEAELELSAWAGFAARIEQQAFKVEKTHSNQK
eukprot:3707391-Pyramimonas_sp.AAC.1